MLQPGAPAPDFALLNQAGAIVRLIDLRRNGPVVVYFYPADSTPGCTREACGFRDRYEALQAAGLQLVGISPQSPESHARFIAQHRLPFDLLADPTKQVIGAYQANGPFGLGVRRVTYLVTPAGRIADGLLADLRIDRHQAFVARLLADRAAAADSLHQPGAGEEAR